MEGGNLDLQTKYDKLASEYSKLRAQATVLRRAVLEEQSKSSNLKETLRSKEISLRRTEQEVDSLCFRNEQLLRRVSTLQEDLDSELKNKKHKRRSETNKQCIDKSIIDEDLAKKIAEIAELASQISEKDSEILQLNERVEVLETRLARQLHESANIESKLRKQLVSQRHKSGDVEIVSESSEAASLVGSEDSISVDENAINVNDEKLINISSHKSILNTTIKSAESNKIIELEREIQHWKTEYELQKMLCTSYPSNTLIHKPNGNNGENKEAQINIKTEILGSMKAPAVMNEEANARETKLRNYFTERLNALAESKSLVASQVNSLTTEISALQNHLEIKENEIKNISRSSKALETKCKEIEEELATTRMNYEEQLRLVTEHAADLYDKLAPVK